MELKKACISDLRKSDRPRIRVGHPRFYLTRMSGCDRYFVPGAYFRADPAKRLE